MMMRIGHHRGYSNRGGVEMEVEREEEMVVMAEMEVMVEVEVVMWELVALINGESRESHLATRRLVW